MSSFSKVLVANRGEIAVRILRTLREMRIPSVAVYSTADRGTLHVRYAGEAHEIGAGPASESYLRIDRVLDVARRVGCDAIHPGYGFLSERPDMARACADAGIAFIGPPTAAIEAMGCKTVARERMASSGIPVVPGSAPLSDDPIGTRAAGDAVGYPLLVKAASGGGGKGMRLVTAPEELAAAVARASSEARSAFGDATVYLEKLVDRPHHVEVQVLSGPGGETVHLFERECSIQRRHQKIIEETPSPILDEPKRQEICRVAVAATRAVDYRGAGTVEFLVDGTTGDFYFLEMNTRIQVEHPVSEMVTGVDIVRAQIEIAAGNPLDLTQAEIHRHGAAIECRIYAEDPWRGFMPSPGRIRIAREPGGIGVRIDSGIFPGADVSGLYDPMLSKLVTWGETRELARRRMDRALSEYVITGVRTNLAYLARVIAHPAFVDGDYDTGFVARYEDDLLRGSPSEASELEEVAMLATAVATYERDRGLAMTADNGSAAGGPSAWRRAFLPER